ncbi:DUF3917 domain-containing protein [Escherichia sp. HC-CC]
MIFFIGITLFAGSIMVLIQ